MTDEGPKLTRTEACHLLIVLAIVCFFVALFFAKVLFLRTG